MVAASCMKESQSKIKHGNFEVEFLFEHEGCKVYRFYDNDYIYYTDCSGKVEWKASKDKHTQVLTN